ncbi:Small nuclear ribonucleoprotein g [Penicillium chermesinum]|uniref:Small nuclear ribonucleoprotein G n=1 Tax=Penicillium chermesinum TaxID=63820 RepID=A0A9W9NZ87_9EURO|nr:Small nuclear ribonucleoprotein g [Penicillium chermesinum]KAJ5232488.1 Small nuclear ribonucleoprotein g [Penicillium chermesinum]KAJ6172145.1 Small nuclear ribonucleoprotein g [Penicillium chermesinum]
MPASAVSNRPADKVADEFHRASLPREASSSSSSSFDTPGPYSVASTASNTASSSDFDLYEPLPRPRDFSHTATMPQAQPDLKQYLDKRVHVQINGNRHLTGVIIGYDTFMNIILDASTWEQRAGGAKHPVGECFIRGNSIITIEALERIGDH